MLVAGGPRQTLVAGIGASRPTDAAATSWHAGGHRQRRPVSGLCTGQFYYGAVYSTFVAVKSWSETTDMPRREGM